MTKQHLFSKLARIEQSESDSGLLNLKLFSYAKRSMVKRLVTSLLNENLVRGVLLDTASIPKSVIESNTKQYKSWCKLTNPSSTEDESVAGENDVFYFGLDEVPIYQKQSLKGGKYYYQIQFIDSDEVNYPLNYHTDTQTIDIETDLSLLLTSVQQWNSIPMDKVESVAEELESCVIHQYYTYLEEKPKCSFESSEMEWEQSIVEGHPTHPMHKTRFPVLPIQSIDVKDNLLNPKVVLFKVPRHKVAIYGNFEHQMEPLYSKYNIDYDKDTEVLFPVHELQIANINEKFPFAQQIQGLHFPSQAQCALRSLILDELPSLVIKLALGIKVTSTLRCISPWGTFIGPHLKAIVDRVVDDKHKLKVVQENATIQVLDQDSDKAKHFSCILRQGLQELCTNEKVIVCAALTERDLNGQYILPELLQLKEESERVEFFQKYCKLYLECFLNPLLKYGFAFEAHLQNVLARFTFNIQTQQYELIGFVVRDLGGVKCDPTKLFQTTGLHLQAYDATAFQISKSELDLAQVFYHTTIQMHLHRILRSLQLHHNGLGWDIIRKELLHYEIDQTSTFGQYFYNTQVDWKSFLKMKFLDLYKDFQFQKIPNLILYQPLQYPEF